MSRYEGRCGICWGKLQLSRDAVNGKKGWIVQYISPNWGRMETNCYDNQAHRLATELEVYLHEAGAARETA